MEVGEFLISHEEIKGFPKFPIETKHKLRKVLTEDLWKSMQQAQDKTGYEFTNCIFLGCKQPKCKYGVWAGSSSSYEHFKELYDQLIPLS